MGSFPSIGKTTLSIGVSPGSFVFLCSFPSIGKITPSLAISPRGFIYQLAGWGDRLSSSYVVIQQIGLLPVIERIRIRQRSKLPSIAPSVCHTEEAIDWSFDRKHNRKNRKKQSTGASTENIIARTWSFDRVTRKKQSTGASTGRNSGTIKHNRKIETSSPKLPFSSTT